MTPMVAAKGARGTIVERIQRRLGESGFDPRGVDGDFGPNTQRAVLDYQAAHRLSATGDVDNVTWMELMDEPPPPTRDRCLQLTAAFEGHSYGHAAGNFDGAGVTWGIIGFTLRHGSLKRIVMEVWGAHPALVEEAFGAKAPELVRIMGAPWSEQLEWADSITLRSDKSRLAKAWRDSFERFGSFPEVRAAQIRRAEEDYFRPALETARQQRLATELGAALCFDIQVQNGGVKPAAARRVDESLAGRPAVSEQERRVILAHAVADASAARWREDVRARKLTIATGAGAVHGRAYQLRSWGLGECGFSI